MAAEVEETLKRLVAHKGVIGTIIVNSDGIPIKSTLDNHTTTQVSTQEKERIEGTVSYTISFLCCLQYSGLLNQLVDQAKTMFKEIDSSNDLTFMRLRTKKHEIMVAPDRDYLLIVIQNTQDGQ